MAFCEKCGAELDENAKFCSACGAARKSGEDAGASPEEESKQLIFCTNCGFQMESGTKYCPSCGTPVGQSGEDETKEAPKDKGGNAFVGDDHTSDFDEADIRDNKGMGILAYFGLLVLIPILAAKDSKFARFHANQGLVRFIAVMITGVVMLVGSFIPFLNVLIIATGAIVSIGLFVLMILGIVNAAQGKAKDLPLIGKLRLLK